MKYTSNVWNKALLSSSGRPVIEDDEHDLLMEANVGLYQGSLKVKYYQLGRIYLTNKRIIYVNENRRRDSLFLNFSQIKNVDFYSGFMKSSPKVIIYVEDNITNSSNKDDMISTTWVCPICSYSNDIFLTVGKLNEMKRSNTKCFSCQTCGVTPEIKLIEESFLRKIDQQGKAINDLVSFDNTQCPNCTFLNHPSLDSCEICGCKLSIFFKNDISNQDQDSIRLELEGTSLNSAESKIIKLSLRNGGNSALYDVIKKTFNESINKEKKNTTSSAQSQEKIFIQSMGGIHGLTQNHTKESEEASILLEKSIQDVSQLMTKANELIIFSQRYKNILAKNRIHNKEVDQSLQLIYQSKKSVKKLDKLKLKTELGESIQNYKLLKALDRLKIGKKSTKTVSKYPELYIEELARSISEFLIRNNIMEKNNGLITLYEIYLLYNKSRQIDLITPEELFDAAQKFEILEIGFKVLKMRLDSSFFNSIEISKDTPFMNIVSRDGSAEYISKKIIHLIHSEPGISDIEIRKRFNTNMVILNFLLNSIVSNGELVIDKTLEGSFYWTNMFL